MTTIAPHATPPTWDMIFQLEPGLAAVALLAVKGGDERAWIAVKHALQALVGWERPQLDELRTLDAYNVAYDALRERFERANRPGIRHWRRREVAK